MVKGAVLADGRAGCSVESWAYYTQPERALRLSQLQVVVASVAGTRLQSAIRMLFIEVAK